MEFECAVKAVYSPTSEAFKSCAITFFDLLEYYQQFSDKHQKYFNKLIINETLNQEKYLEALLSNQQVSIILIS